MDLSLVSVLPKNLKGIVWNPCKRGNPSLDLELLHYVMNNTRLPLLKNAHCVFHLLRKTDMLVFGEKRVSLWKRDPVKATPTLPKNTNQPLSGLGTSMWHFPIRSENVCRSNALQILFCHPKCTQRIFVFAVMSLHSLQNIL